MSAKDLKTTIFETDSGLFVRFESESPEGFSFHELDLLIVAARHAQRTLIERANQELLEEGEELDARFFEQQAKLPGEWLRDAEPGYDWAWRNAWYQEQAMLWISIDPDFPFLHTPRDMPVLILHEYGYPDRVRVGDYLGCAVGTRPSVVKIVRMPTRKRLVLECVDGPHAYCNWQFEWKRDLLLPFWPDGSQRRLF